MLFLLSNEPSNLPGAIQRRLQGVTDLQSV
jgi:hypothetical protein